MGVAATVKEALTGVDLHGRDKDAQKEDKWFMEELAVIRQRSGSLTALPASRYGYASKGAFLTIERVRGEKKEDEKISIVPGLYDLSLMKKLATEMGLAKTAPDEIAKALSERAVVSFGVSVTPEGGIGSQGGVRLAPVPDGYVSAPGIKIPILGTAIVFDHTKDTKDNYRYGSLLTKAEYLRWLPAMHSTWSAHNGWCVDLPCERVAYLADETQAMLDNLNNQLKNLHDVSVYAISPRWFRYYSDGDMRTQRSAQYGKRSAPLPGGGMRPLIYEGPAWVVGLKMGTNMVPGRVFVTPEGRFIGSDWCQREADKEGGIDLHTGQYTKHTLMTWCAGPGISRFGNAETQARHGTVRRASINQAKIASVKQVAARKKLMQMLVTVKAKPKLRTAMLLDSDATQAASLRYFKVHVGDLDKDHLGWGDYDTLVGFVARFGKYTHILVVPLNDEEIIVPQHAVFHRFAGNPVDTEACAGANYFITDLDMAKEIVATMKECFSL